MDDFISRPKKRPAYKIKRSDIEQPQRKKPTISKTETAIPRFQSYKPVHYSQRPQQKTRKFIYDKNWSTRKKRVFWAFLTFLTAVLLMGGYYAYRVMNGASGVFNGSYLDLVTKSELLQKDRYG